MIEELATTHASTVWNQARNKVLCEAVFVSYRAEEPRRLEVMKNLTGLWGSTGQGQPQPTPRANRLSPSLAQYLASTVTPRTFDLQIMGMTSDLMDFLDMPEERLSIELWDLGEGTGDQRYKANWQFSEEHGNVLMEGVWLQKDDNW